MHWSLEKGQLPWVLFGEMVSGLSSERSVSGFLKVSQGIQLHQIHFLNLHYIIYKFSVQAVNILNLYAILKNSLSCRPVGLSG